MTPQPAIAVPLALALGQCSKCHGYGRCMSRSSEVICSCVFRRVFRDCMARVRRMRDQPLEMARRPALRRSNSGSRLSYGFPNVEFAADLENSAKRILQSQTRELLVWKYHYLGNLDWKACVPVIGRDLGRPIDRGEFFHCVYRAERQLGRAWLELRMWPRDYFAGTWYMIGELLASSRGSGTGSIGVSQHTVLTGHPQNWDNRRAIDPSWPGNFPGSPDTALAHRFTDRERQLSERVDAWMAA